MRFLIAYLLLATSALAADPQCAPTDQIRDGLDRNFGETVITTGTTGSGWQMDLYANTKTGTWTIIMSNPANGIGCIAASGLSLKYQPPGDPA